MLAKFARPLPHSFVADDDAAGGQQLLYHAKAERKVGPTRPTRNVMVEGASGILAISPGPERPLYEPSKRRLTWPNGAVATTYSADEPERLRGPQHEAGWCNELAAWRYPEAWDMLMFGMRLGADPRTVVTTTPRPAKLIRDLVRDPICVVTRGTSYENRGNLAPAFFEQIIRKYQGTRLGRQELDAELLEDTPGALWSHGSIEATAHSSHILIRCSTRRSTTRRATDFISSVWGMLPKKSARSASTTSRYPQNSSSSTATAACWAFRPGR